MSGNCAEGHLLPADTVWLTPVRIVSADGPAFGTGPQEASYDSTYGAAKVIDNDLATFCCLLDDTPGSAETHPESIPVGGVAPVTGRIRFDLGRAMRIVGIRLVARQDGGVYAPKGMDIACLAGDETAEGSDREAGTGGGEWVLHVKNHTVPPLTRGAIYDVPFPATLTRSVELRVNDSFESGPVHFNFQLAEFRVAVELTEDAKRLLAEQARQGQASELKKQLDRLSEAIEFLSGAYANDYPGTRLQDEVVTLRKEMDTAASEPWYDDNRSLSQAGQSLERLKCQALVAQNPLLRPGQLLFVRRKTYQTGWYYAEFMQAGPPGGNLCVLDLHSGAVTELCPQLAAGIFDRFDLSFDGRRIVFGYRPVAEKALRLYEVQVDGSGLRQLTVDPPNESARLAAYGLDPTRNELGPWRAHTDDFHPCYLPDGGVAFASSRCERGVLCDAEDNLSVNVLYRMDGDGRNVTLLSGNALSESTPTVMNDGRVLYTRWEYVHKGVIAVQSLWAMRPDGSHSTEVFGNQHVYPPVLIHGRAVPGSNNLFVATCTMHHPFAVGPIVLVDTNKDIRTRAPLTNLTPDTDVTYEGSGTFPNGESFLHQRQGRWVRDNTGPLFCDPWPLSDKFFLVSSNPDKAYNDPTAYGLWLIDTFGNRVRIYQDPQSSCWQPVPLRPRQVPASPSHADSGHDQGQQDTTGQALPPAGARDGATGETTPNLEAQATLLMTDVYRGLNGIPHGEIKYLRILEQVPRPWTARRFWPDDVTCGQNAAISLGSHIFVTILHGVVPVDEDGSAHFSVPAGRNLFFQALDEQYMEIERMRTFVNLQPSEMRSCIGCHQSRNEAPPVKTPLAMMRPADRPRPQPGDLTASRPLYYPTDVQPILDRHCVRCHGGPETRESDLVLTGEATTFFSRSYEEIMGRKLIAFVQEFVGADPEAQKGNVTPLGPKALGSHASRLISVLRNGHYEVTLNEFEWVRLITWVDANGPFYGSYFGRRNLQYKDLPDFRPVPTLDSARGIGF